jgi:hypothetical protein
MHNLHSMLTVHGIRPTPQAIKAALRQQEQMQAQLHTRPRYASAALCHAHACCAHQPGVMAHGRACTGAHTAQMRTAAHSTPWCVKARRTVNTRT